ncbi:MAG: phosphonate ABC transporter substrate-binding protein [Azospirillum sp.]|nr:phosphonate ABC transporter substrate-binding protein [Azospirillum sp.]
MLRKILIAAVMVVCGLAPFQGAKAAPLAEINFGIISTESTKNLKAQWDPFLADMARITGIKINAFFAPDYAGIIEGMRFNKVQIAWFGNKSAMEAVDRASGEIFVQSVDSDGNPGYWSLLLANKENDKINTIDDVLKCDQSLNFGNGDPNSTSGFLVPSYYVFALNNVDPKKCYKTVRNANHETNLMAVANNQVDFATNNTENLRQLEIKNPEAFKKLKIVWQSPLIPSDPLVWRKDLDDETKARLMSFFMSYGRLGASATHDREVLKALLWAPFRLSSNAQLYPIRQLDLFKKKVKVESDDRLDPADKVKQLTEIDSKLGVVKLLADNQ